MLIISGSKPRTCGIVICREGEDGVEVLLAKEKGKKYWELPKGRSKQGETAEETAKREVFEEVGVDVKKMDPLYDGIRNGRNLVFFVADADEEPDVSKPNEHGIQEFEKARYFPLDKALKKIVHWQKQILERLE